MYMRPVRKTERVANWTSMVRNPPEPPVLSDADMLLLVEQELQELEQQRLALEARTVELSATRAVLSERISRDIGTIDPIRLER